MARAWTRSSAAALLLLFLFSSFGEAQPPEPSPPKVSKMTIYNGASRYVTYQVPPDASPHVQALYTALGQAENDQYLTDQLQQLLLDYTEQERILGAVRTSREINHGNAPTDTGSDKAHTVLGFVAAAQARSEFAGQVNRNLEQLQLQVAALKAGPRAARDALHDEASALRRQREAWQSYQVTLSQQAPQDSIQAARENGQYWGVEFEKVSMGLARQMAAVGGGSGNNGEQTAWPNQPAALLQVPTAWKAVVQALTQ